ncbi:uncharacterized protein UV8b_02743 [Ustilaginoidea virens]|uniref:Uncharacterized protein n=1 Tax=Ustilaginoidea virens TaxID=1159556 RepID=A0A8E5MGE9_USTVR|nr:uncharacterized protein UV8b_02743 [Ustilaginoidea virens]QUC18502.1 hypothetical protein UV8b_02743 [Ustilaginoidea virens]
MKSLALAMLAATAVAVPSQPKRAGKRPLPSPIASANGRPPIWTGYCDVYSQQCVFEYVKTVVTYGRPTNMREFGFANCTQNALCLRHGDRCYAMEFGGVDRGACGNVPTIEELRAEARARVRARKNPAAARRH